MRPVWPLRAGSSGPTPVMDRKAPCQWTASELCRLSGHVRNGSLRLANRIAGVGRNRIRYKRQHEERAPQAKTIFGRF